MENVELNFNDVVSTLGLMRECLVLKDSRKCSRNCDSCRINIPDIAKIRVLTYTLTVMQSLVPLLNAEEEKPKKKRSTAKKEVKDEADKKTNSTTKRVSRKKKQGD